MDLSTNEKELKYSIPYNRNLKSWEKNLLEIILRQSKPEWTKFIKDIQVIGRCGCGKCPTILLGLNENERIIPNQTKIVDYQGIDSNGHLIGISIFGDEFPSELEFWSIDGNSELLEDIVINVDSISEMK